MPRKTNVEKGNALQTKNKINYQYLKNNYDCWIYIRFVC